MGTWRTLGEHSADILGGHSPSFRWDWWCRENSSTKECHLFTGYKILSRARGAGSPSIRQTSKPRRDTVRKPFSPHKGGLFLSSLDREAVFFLAMLNQPYDQKETTFYERQFCLLLIFQGLQRRSDPVYGEITIDFGTEMDQN